MPQTIYVDSSESNCRIYDDLMPSLLSAIDSLPGVAAEAGDMTSDAYVQITIDVPTLERRERWVEGEAYYEPEIDYDCRPDVLAAVERVRAALANDIARRPKVTEEVPDA